MEDISVVQELIALVREMSPVLWETGRQQAFTYGVVSLVWSIVSLIILFTFSILFGRVFSNLLNKTIGEFSEPSSIDPPGWTFLFSFFVVTWIVIFLITLRNILWTVKYFMNPNYYAIQFLLELVK